MQATVTASLGRREILSLPSTLDCATSRRLPPSAGHGHREDGVKDHIMTPNFQPRSAWHLALGVVVLLALPTTPGWSQGDPVIAKVNGVEIRQSDLTLAEEDLSQNLPPGLQGDAKRDYLISYLADILLAAKAAETRKVSDQKDFKNRIAYVRNKLLMQTLLENEAKAAVTDTALKAVYEDAIKQMSSDQEVRARHILVPTEAEAKAILVELNKGTDFAELARQKSKDPGAASQGGDLGYFTKEQMVPEFSEVAFKLDKGKLSDPVKTQFGWHIIKVEDKRKKAPPEFTQVKDQVETYVMRKAQAEFITKLRQGAKIERLDKK
jgi:peptidyl-prolyl cis-trans isomerase C